MYKAEQIKNIGDALPNPNPKDREFEAEIIDHT